MCFAKQLALTRQAVMAHGIHQQGGCGGVWRQVTANTGVRHKLAIQL